MDRDRVLAVNMKSLEEYFKCLNECITRSHIDPDDMWNFDEKGFMMGRSGKKNELIISRVRVKAPRRIQQASREWVTLIEYVSATGKRLPAFYIYAEKGWHQNPNIDPETVFAYTDNGWTKDYVGYEWLQNHFGKFATPSKPGKTRLLLCDNYSFHDNYEFYGYCLANDIALFFFPAHATHILQSLDIGVFGPLDRYCNQEVGSWTSSQPLHTPLLKGDFLSTYV